MDEATIIYLSVLGLVAYVTVSLYVSGTVDRFLERKGFGDGVQIGGAVWTFLFLIITGIYLLYQWGKNES